MSKREAHQCALAALRKLRTGWNEYEAPPPGQYTIDRAERLLDLLEVYDIEPCYFGAVVDGGVDFTFFDQDGVEYTLQYLNDGSAMGSICDCGTTGGRCKAFFDKLFGDLKRGVGDDDSG